MWLETDRGNRIPAFHIRRGHHLTVCATPWISMYQLPLQRSPLAASTQILVSHANAEDLGIVLGFWTYMSDALQVDVLAYECKLHSHSIRVATP